MKSFEFNVNGFTITAEYADSNIREMFLPLLARLTKLAGRKGKRLIVYLAAPPGTGKTTLAMFLEYLSGTDPKYQKIQSVGLDGFHYRQEYINTHTACVDGKEVPMRDVKGCPETFDINKVTEKLEALMHGNVSWPVYDRSRHDVVEDAVMVTESIVLIEGNWLLLQEQGWCGLSRYCDYSIFVRAEEAMLKERLVERKIKGGLTPDEAEQFYDNSDRKNILRVLGGSRPADLTLNLLKNGMYNGGVNDE